MRRSSWRSHVIVSGFIWLMAQGASAKEIPDLSAHFARLASEGFAAQQVVVKADGRLVIQTLGHGAGRDLVLGPKGQVVLEDRSYSLETSTDGVETGALRAKNLRALDASSALEEGENVVHSHKARKAGKADTSPKVEPETVQLASAWQAQGQLETLTNWLAEIFAVEPDPNAYGAQNRAGAELNPKAPALRNPLIETTEPPAIWSEEHQAWVEEGKPFWSAKLGGWTNDGVNLNAPREEEEQDEAVVEAPRREAADNDSTSSGKKSAKPEKSVAPDDEDEATDAPAENAFDSGSDAQEDDDADDERSSDATIDVAPAPEAQAASESGVKPALSGARDGDEESSDDDESDDESDDE